MTEYALSYVFGGYIYISLGYPKARVMNPYWFTRLGKATDFGHLFAQEVVPAVYRFVMCRQTMRTGIRVLGGTGAVVPVSGDSPGNGEVRAAAA